MSPIAIDTNYTHTTYFFDCLSPMHSEIMKRQVNEMFKPEYYLYLQEKDYSPWKEDPDRGKNFIRLIGEKVRSLNLNLLDGEENLFFLVEMDRLDESMIEQLLGFFDAYLPHTRQRGAYVRSYLCVCKVDANTKEDMDHFDISIDRLLKDRQGKGYYPRILLLDTPAAADPEAWFRCIARYAAILSATNPLSTGIQSIPADSIQHWVMSEYDVEAMDRLNTVRKEAEIQLDGRLDETVFEANINRLKDEYAQRARGSFSLTDDSIPIPAACIGGLLGRKRAQEETEALVIRINKAVEECITQSCFTPLSEEEKRQYYKILTDGIPVRLWDRMIKKRIREAAQREFTKVSTGVNLMPATSLSKLRDNIATELNTVRRNVSTRAKDEIWKVLTEEEDLFSELSKERENELTGIIRRSRQLWYLGGVNNERQYLSNILQISDRRLIGILAYDVTPIRRSFILVSDIIQERWIANQYDMYVPDNIQSYNYHDLGEYEFQTLTVYYWTKDQYEQTKRTIFRQ